MNYFGVVGEKLSHSLSPVINKRIFELIGVEGAYKTFEIPKDEIKKLPEAIKLLDIRGVNITIPYKEVLIEQLDFISKDAKDIGAINTIFNKDGKLSGYNTDYFGFKKMLEVNNIEVKDKVCTVLGTGGAAKAVVTYLLDEGAKDIYLVTRNKAKDISANDNINIIDYKELEDLYGDVLINTTPVGMYPSIPRSPVSSDIIKNFSVLVDLIYNPKVTEFLKIGEELGKKTCDGLYMLVGQAVKSEEIWNEREISIEVINKIYKELEERFI